MPVPGLDNYAQPLDQLKSFHDVAGGDRRGPRGPARGLRLHESLRRDELLEQTAQTVQGGRLRRADREHAACKGEYLDSEGADDFFAMAAELGVPVFLHPGAEPVGSDSVRDFRLVEQVGRFFDVAVSLATLVVSGRLEQYPELRFIAATAGGGIATVFNRVDLAQRARPPQDGVVRAELSRSPSDYLRGVYVDTANQNPASHLANLELMGPERMLFGTDSPPMATPLEAAISMVGRSAHLGRGEAGHLRGQRQAAVRPGQLTSRF